GRRNDSDGRGGRGRHGERRLLPYGGQTPGRGRRPFDGSDFTRRVPGGARGQASGTLSGGGRSRSRGKRSRLVERKKNLVRDRQFHARARRRGAADIEYFPRRLPEETGGERAGDDPQAAHRRLPAGRYGRSRH